MPGGHFFVWKISKKDRSRARPVRRSNFIGRARRDSVVGAFGPRGLGGVVGGGGRGEKRGIWRKMVCQTVAQAVRSSGSAFRCCTAYSAAYSSPCTALRRASRSHPDRLPPPGTVSAAPPVSGTPSPLGKRFPPRALTRTARSWSESLLVTAAVCGEVRADTVAWARRPVKLSRRELVIDAAKV